MKRTLIIIALLSLVVVIATGQCPHAFFKAHTLKGPTVCEMSGCTYAGRMKSLIPCALNEARYEMSVKFPGRDAQWAEAEGPEVLVFHDGLFISPSLGVVYGSTEWIDDGTFRTIIGLTGTDEDFDTMIHEAEHVLAARVLKGAQAEKFHQQLDNGNHTSWFAENFVR